jgi:flagellar biogenesis protein FliO
MAKPTFASSLRESLDSEIAALKVQRESAVSEPEEQAAPLSPPQDLSPVPVPPEYAPPVVGYAPAPSAPLPRTAVPQRAGGSGARLLIVVGGVVLIAVLAFILLGPLGLLRFGTGSPAIQPTVTPGSGTAAPGTPTPSPAFSEPPSPLTSSPLFFIFAGLLVVLIVVLVTLVVVRRGRTPTQAPAVIALSGPTALGALDQRIVRLEQLRSWMGEDPDLGRLIDTSIGSQVHASERRQRFFAGTLGIITLVAGWLLSAVSPPAALASLLHLGH